MNKYINRAVLRMSDIYAPTLKEDPSDADIASAKLLTRAGMIRKEAAGLYTFLPLGMRVIRKIENIVREEMDSHGGQEVLMPFVQSADLWHRSGRWDAYGAEMLRVTDRHGNEFCLGPTHERPAEEPLSDPGEVPRRASPALRASARSRVHHERRLQLQCRPGKP